MYALMINGGITARFDTWREAKLAAKRSARRCKTAFIAVMNTETEFVKLYS